MIGSELDAAGVHDPVLGEAYRRYRDINSRHGRTFRSARCVVDAAP